MIVKVVDLINDAQDDVRPTVLVSATAVGYYGLCLKLTFTLLLSSGIYKDNDIIARACFELVLSNTHI